MGNKGRIFLILFLLYPTLVWSAFKTDVVKTDTLMSQTGTDTVTLPQLSDAVSKKHTQGHYLGSPADHTDVDTTGITDGQGLKWDAATKKWLPVTFPSGGGTVTGTGTSGKMTLWTGASAIGDASNTDAEVASAVTKSHDAATVDTGLQISGQKINLANTAVTPGSYTNTDLTVDAQGRLTAASSGSGGSGSVQVDTAIGTDDISVDTTVYVDMKDMTYTDTFTAGNVFILFDAPGFYSAPTNFGYVRIVIDGSSVRTGGVWIYSAATMPLSLSWSAYLSAGSHTIKVQWKRSADVVEQRGATVGSRLLTIIRNLN